MSAVALKAALVSATVALLEPLMVFPYTLVRFVEACDIRLIEASSVLTLVISFLHIVCPPKAEFAGFATNKCH